MGDDELTEELLKEATDEVLDAKEAAEIARRNRPLSGDYATDPESFGDLTVTREVNEDDGGRVSYQFAGRCQSARRGHEDVVNFLRFRISAQSRPKVDFETGETIEGKDDLRTRLYSEAFRLYTIAHEGVAPRTMETLTEWVSVTPGVRLNTMAGDAGDLVVLHVKGPRRGRE